jgi:RHS repeat-associated protein
MRYYPYGETRSGTMDTDRLYTGQRWEAGIGLYDYNARYYDPALGRFVQADTVVPSMANPQDFNRYSYVRGNPLRYIDPSGHCISPGCIIEISVLVVVSFLASGCSQPTHPVQAPSGSETKHYYSEAYGWFDKNHFNDHNILQKVTDTVAQGGGNITLHESQVGDMHLYKDYWVSGDIEEEQIPGVALAIFMDFQAGWEDWQGQNAEGFTYYSVDDLPSNMLAFIASLQNMSADSLLSELGAYPTRSSPPPPRRVTARFNPVRLDIETGQYVEVDWPWDLPQPIYNSALWRPISAKKVPLLGQASLYYNYE